MLYAHPSDTFFLISSTSLILSYTHTYVIFTAPKLIAARVSQCTKRKYFIVAFIKRLSYHKYLKYKFKISVKYVIYIKEDFCSVLLFLADFTLHFMPDLNDTFLIVSVMKCMDG